MKRVEPEEFQRTLESVMENPDLVPLLRPLMAYDMGTGHQTRWIESTNDYTTQVLYRLGFKIFLISSSRSSPQSSSS